MPGRVSHRSPVAELLYLPEWRVLADDIHTRYFEQNLMERMNGEVEACVRADRIARTSRKVREESMLVNAEFAAIERDLDA
jgi:hypothetical protein